MKPKRAETHFSKRGGVVAVKMNSINAAKAIRTQNASFETQNKTQTRNAKQERSCQPIWRFCNGICFFFLSAYVDVDEIITN